MTVVTARVILGIIGLLSLTYGIIRWRRRSAILSRAPLPQGKSQGVAGQSFWDFPRAAWALILSFLGGLTMISSVVGPLWPTELSISTAGLYQSNSADKPFEIENKSLIFPIRIISGKCTIVKAIYPNNTSIEDTAVSETLRSGIIPPAGKKTYDCRLIDSPYQPLFMEEKVNLVYEYLYWPFWHREEVSDTLTWDQGTFRVGDPLQ